MHKLNLSSSTYMYPLTCTCTVRTLPWPFNILQNTLTDQQHLRKKRSKGGEAIVTFLTFVDLRSILVKWQHLVTSDVIPRGIKLSHSESPMVWSSLQCCPMACTVKINNMSTHNSKPLS